MARIPAGQDAERDEVSPKDRHRCSRRAMLRKLLIRIAGGSGRAVATASKFRTDEFSAETGGADRRMRIGLIAIAGVKIQTRKFVELGVTLPQFVNRGRVIAQLPSLALLTLAGATPQHLPQIELEYVEVDDVAGFVEIPRLDFDLVAISTYTARAFDAYRVADTYRQHGIPVVFGGLHATILPAEAMEHADSVVAGEGELTWPEVVRDFSDGGVHVMEVAE